MNVSVKIDYSELEKHKICTYGGVYLKELENGSFEIRCCSRFHGGADLLVVAIPAPSNKARGGFAAGRAKNKCFAKAANR